MEACLPGIFYIHPENIGYNGPFTPGGLHMQPMKALCVCHYGHSRSVALVRVLHGMGIEAVAAGAHTAGSRFLKVMSEEATHIFVMEPQFREQIPHEDREKVVCLNVGPDRWSNPYNQELLALCKKLLEEWANRTSEYSTLVIEETLYPVRKP